MYFHDILEDKDYLTNDPIIRNILDDAVRQNLADCLNPVDNNNDNTKKKGKNTVQQTMFSLKNADGKFKYIWGEEQYIQDFDYEQQQRKRKQRYMQLVELPRFKKIGQIKDKNNKSIPKPVLKLTDAYLITNPKIKRLIDKAFERVIKGKIQTNKYQGVVVSRSASNYQQLQNLIKNYQNRQEQYNFENQQNYLNQQQLEEYLIERGQSKSDYFLFYKQNQPLPAPKPQNHPLMAANFIKQLHSQVRQKQKQYYNKKQQPKFYQKKMQVQPLQNSLPSNTNLSMKQSIQNQQKQKKIKQYFGQFGTSKPKQNIYFDIQDKFKKQKDGQQLAESIIQYFSYVDNDIINQKYKRPLAQNDYMEFNLSNPYFFQPKLHTILAKQKQILQQNQYLKRLAQANKGKLPQKSLISGQGVSKQGMEGTMYNFQNQTIQNIIQQEMRNLSKQPLKHSDIANKFDLVRFILEEDAFQNFHRYYFPFHNYMQNKVKIQLWQHKIRKFKPNGLIFNAEMRQTNQKFTTLQDLSCIRGQFILIEYIEQIPLLMSEIGMCQRMFVQINYQEVLDKMRQQILQNVSIQYFQKQADKKQKQNIILTFKQHAQLWRKTIKDIFGQHGKQLYWDTKVRDNKLIGTPDGPGVLFMESNLATIPIVRKKAPRRQFLLVRQGDRWVLRQISHLYVSGQVQPKQRVFCPGSRQHTQFKSSYQRAYILRQLRTNDHVNLDVLKQVFKGQTQNALRKVLKLCSAISKDGKNFRMHGQPSKGDVLQLTPQGVCLFQRMQKTICQLKQFGLKDTISMDKQKNVLKMYIQKNYLNPQQIVIGKLIKQMLHKTSWYLTDCFCKFKQKNSKIQINGIADPTNGRGGYSFINKPQKQRTPKEDMIKRNKDKKQDKRDLRKMKCQQSKQYLRSLGYNQGQLQKRGRWQLIKQLKQNDGTQFSRKDRETKMIKIQNEKKDINKNFNRLLAWLNDLTQQPAFLYRKEKKLSMSYYIQKYKDYIQKIKDNVEKKQKGQVYEEENDDSEDM